VDRSDNPLGEFLRARRGLVEPSDHGIRDGGRRRVPGLRREELAFLAGVSAPYYARLEQGRDRSPSPEVLDAIAAVLRLDAEAVQHLHRLAAPARGRMTRAAAVSPLVRRLLDDWGGHAALVVGRYRDVLAANPLATALNPAFAAGRNLVRDTFLDPTARTLYADWPDVAVGAVAGLRASAGERPDDPALRDLVGELSVTSDDFRTMWARHDVHAKTSGTKRFRHPAVGSLELEYQTFDVNGTDGQVLHVFAAEPGSTSADGLALLAMTAVRHAESAP
jgi:transcriptional regulator with XRE-family HTH domain